MAKKKKTLPNNFNELIEKKDIENLKKVFETCELDARGGYAKATAISFTDIPNEIVRWLVESGADIDATDIYERTALHKLANARSGDITTLLELGANANAIDNDGDTPLHFASGSSFNVNTVKKLIEFGVQTNVLNKNNQTPLEYALANANNSDLIELVEISKIFLETNNEITQKMKDAVVIKGEKFEFHRENFNKDSLLETEKALNELYQIYNVAPIKKRIMHDGISPIAVNSSTWQKQFEELWEFLIPSSGSAKTIQGEVIRIAGKVRDEINRNGGVNWNNDFKKMLDAFYLHISTGNSIENDELNKAILIIKQIRNNGNGENDELDFLCELATKWAVNNPIPILLDKTDYKR